MFITKRLWLSFTFTSIIIFLLSIINKTKLYYRDDVFKFEDVFLAKEALIMTTRYDIIILWYTVIGILITILLILWLKKYVKTINIKYRYSLIYAVLLLMVAIFGYNKYYTDDELYLKLGDKSLINVWIETRQFQIRGFIYPFIYSSKNAFPKAPDGYDKKEAEKILSKYAYDNIPEDKKVNIISVMLEAYNDFSKFSSIEFTDDVYKDLHDIEKKSLYGELKVDIFGGGTVNTERHYITGFIDLPNFRRNTYSYATYFKEQGYVADSMHPSYGSFYNRNSVNINLGFDYYWDYENMFKVDEGFMQDKDFSYEKLLNLTKQD